MTGAPSPARSPSAACSNSWALTVSPSPMQGDWGTQFGMLIQYMAEKRPGGLNAATDEDVADLQASPLGGWDAPGLLSGWARVQAARLACSPCHVL